VAIQIDTFKELPPNVWLVWDRWETRPHNHSLSHIGHESRDLIVFRNKKFEFECSEEEGYSNIRECFTGFFQSQMLSFSLCFPKLPQSR